MSNITLRILPRDFHPSTGAGLEANALPMAISFAEPVRLQLELPASAVDVVHAEDGELRYRFDVELDLPFGGKEARRREVVTTAVPKDRRNDPDGGEGPPGGP